VRLRRIGVAGVALLALAGCSTAASSATPSPASSATAASSPSSSSPSASSPPAPPTSDPTAGWLSYSSKSADLSFRYPSSWNVAECDPSTKYSLGSGSFITSSTIDATIFLDGPKSCPVEDESPVVLIDASVPGQAAQSFSLAGGKCGSTVSSSAGVTVDGSAGTRTSFSFPNGYVHCIGGPFTSAVEYTFISGKRSYRMTYTEYNGGPDLIGQFDLIVQHTMAFAAR
jgi:hypothetical protein